MIELSIHKQKFTVGKVSVGFVGMKNLRFVIASDKFMYTVNKTLRPCLYLVAQVLALVASLGGICTISCKGFFQLFVNDFRFIVICF